MTPRNSLDLPALDATLGPVLTSALRAGRPATAVVLAVLARAHSENVPAGRCRVWLRSRCRDAEVAQIVTETAAWRTLTAAAKRHGAESPIVRRRRIARRAVAALLQPLPAGDAALIAVLALGMLDDENAWDSALVSKRLGVTLGVTHTAVSARVRKLVESGTLTLLSRGRGVPGRVRFAKLPASVSSTLESNPTAVGLVDLLAGESEASPVSNGGAANAAAVLRAVTEPSVGYGPLSDAAWQYALLRALGAEDALPQGRRTRARRALRSAGLDPDDARAFVDAARTLSEGEPARLRDEREAGRAVEAAERAASAERSRAQKKAVHEKVLPGLLAHVGAVPKTPTREWVGAMREACAGVVADESKREVVALLRGALRQKLLRAGWSTDEVTRGIAIILPKAA
ncbi:hypothetical protein [Microbacterium dextranolyticum]|uniref:Uncharacterized protein n=1 Tax=Microbacterium dextranolyticum TaxID=36806 RepID=A0A9W6HM41_9MICO|nr:hypothetical protein [Microbacterium dextranolyticum]MBM7463173.1 hypothetical protein [Microbacterium dextranolyticum]GLJ95721.1 hypothetical protein GCM10017591_17840 [Microbacterium dextranolyticum]